MREVGATERSFVQEATVSGKGPLLGDALGILLGGSPHFGKLDAHHAPQLPRDVRRHIALGDDIRRQRFGEHPPVPAARGQRLNRFGLLDGAECLEPRHEQLAQSFIVERRHGADRIYSKRGVVEDSSQLRHERGLTLRRERLQRSTAFVNRDGPRPHRSEVAPGRLGVAERVGHFSSETRDARVRRSLQSLDRCRPHGRSDEVDPSLEAIPHTLEQARLHPGRSCDRIDQWFQGVRIHGSARNELRDERNAALAGAVEGKRWIRGHERLDAQPHHLWQIVVCRVFRVHQ